MHTLLVHLGTAVPALVRSESARSDGNWSTAALIAVAGIAMILATSGLIFVVVRRKPADSGARTARRTPVEEPDTANT